MSTNTSKFTDSGIVSIAQDLEAQFSRQDWSYAWYTASKLQNKVEELKWLCKEKEAEHLKAIALSR